MHSAVAWFSVMSVLCITMGSAVFAVSSDHVILVTSIAPLAALAVTALVGTFTLIVAGVSQHWMEHPRSRDIALWGLLVAYIAFHVGATVALVVAGSTCDRDECDFGGGSPEANRKQRM